MIYKNHKKFNSLALKLNSMINWFLDDRSSVLELDGYHRPKEIAFFLSETFESLYLGNNYFQDTSIQYKPKKYDEDFLKNLNDSYISDRIKDIYDYVNNYLSKYISSFILHGSLATLDFSKGWSDVDTFVVIKNSTLLNGEDLYEFRNYCINLKKLFYRICPLQHHGLIVFTEEEINNYSINYIPHQILNASIQFLENSDTIDIGFDSKDSDLSSSNTIKRIRKLKLLLFEAIKSGKLCHHPHKQECLENDFSNAGNGMRQIFWMSGNVMTMPAYLLTAIGHPCEKKYSFERVLDLYSVDSLKFIEKFSKARILWAKLEGVQYEGNQIPLWFQEIIGEKYFEGFFDLLSETLEIIDRNFK